jgi:hypothetical protein
MAKKAKSTRRADALRTKEPGRQRRAKGSPAEMPKRIRETRLRQRY